MHCPGKPKLVALALAAAALACAPAAARAQAPAPAPAPAAQPGADTTRVYKLSEVDEPPHLANATAVQRLMVRTYPEALARSRATGSVMLRFVVDAEGRVEPGSVQVESSSDPAFEPPATQLALQMRFSPGRVSGHPVRVLAAFPLEFAIDR